MPDGPHRIGTASTGGTKRTKKRLQDAHGLREVGVAGQPNITFVIGRCLLGYATHNSPSARSDPRNGNASSQLICSTLTVVRPIAVRPMSVAPSYLKWWPHLRAFRRPCSW